MAIICKQNNYFDLQHISQKLSSQNIQTMNILTLCFVATTDRNNTDTHKITCKYDNI